MLSPSQRVVSLEILHPTFRKRVQEVIADLAAESLPFEVFESFRTPQRQAFLYAKGRTTPGPAVTKAKPWLSYHQYGLAVDMVLKINGGWSWDTSGKRAAMWRRLHEIADIHGLEPLSWELPHLQLKGLTAGALFRGEYPAFGDEGWAESLSAAIQDWEGGNSPPLPPATSDRPPMEMLAADQTGDGLPESGEQSSDSELSRPATPQEGSSLAMAGRFEAIQSMIDKWEGPYVDHPADPGGATNMGITQATLAAWRGRSVTKDEVKNLSRAEQRQIMKARYYNVIGGDGLPAPVCAVTYNASILHGTKRAAIFLQTCAKRFSPGLPVDGAIGPLTIAAVGAIPSDQLVDDYVNLELNFMKSLKHWPVFGKGWTNRLEDMRTFAKGLSSYGDVVPPLDSSDVTRGAAPVEDTVQQGTGALGVDNMLGQTIGNLLVGKKTTIGGLGTLLSVLAPQIGSALGVDASQVGAVQSSLLPISLTMLGWGGLGKIDRWIGSLGSKK